MFEQLFIYLYYLLLLLLLFVTLFVYFVAIEFVNVKPKEERLNKSFKKYRKRCKIKKKYSENDKRCVYRGLF